MKFFLTRTRQIDGRDVYSLYPWNIELPGVEMQGVEGVTIINARAQNFSISPEAPGASLKALLESLPTPQKPLVNVVTTIPEAWHSVVAEYL